MAELSEAEVQRAKEILHNYYVNGDESGLSELFGIIDRDGSGSLEGNEIEPIIAAVAGKHLEAGTIDEIIKAADSDGNSTIELNELKGFLDIQSVRSLLNH